MLGFGIPSVHRPLGMAMELYLGIRNPAWFERFDAFSDLPISTYWQELHESVPGSKVIATWRPLEEWLESIEEFISGTAQPGLGTAERDRLRLASFGSIAFNKRKFSDTYGFHYEKIREYESKNPDDILVLDITSEVDMGLLARFVSVDSSEGGFSRFPFARSPRIGRLSAVDRDQILEISQLLRENEVKHTAEL
jgi:hypothetical protein